MTSESFTIIHDYKKYGWRLSLFHLLPLPLCRNANRWASTLRYFDDLHPSATKHVRLSRKDKSSEKNLMSLCSLKTPLRLARTASEKIENHYFRKWRAVHFIWASIEERRKQAQLDMKMNMIDENVNYILVIICFQRRAIGSEVPGSKISHSKRLIDGRYKNILKRDTQTLRLSERQEANTLQRMDSVDRTSFLLF